MIREHIVNRMHPGQMIQAYLMSSYCYYHMDQSPMTDPAFDRLCVRLLEAWPTFNHPHKHIVNRDDLVAGTCMLHGSTFPNMVICAAMSYMDFVTSGTYEKEIEPHLMPEHVQSIATKRIIRRPPPVAATTVIPALKRVVRRPLVSAPVVAPVAVQSSIRRVRRPIQ